MEMDTTSKGVIDMRSITTGRTVLAATFVAATFAAVVAPPPAAAQLPAGGAPGPVRLHAEASLIYARPTGEFAEQVDRGFGIGVAASLPLTGNGVLSMVVDGGFVNYGNERREVCLSSTVGCRIRVDLTTSNNIVFGGIGPQLSVPLGAVQPYLRGTAGFSYFATHSSLRGTREHDSFASTENHNDVVFALGAGGGVRIDLPVATVPVQLNLGARYHANGRAEYLRRGDIEDLPDGSIVLHPQRTDANLVSYHVGITIGIRQPAR
jgi:hypothetical protein